MKALSTITTKIINRQTVETCLTSDEWETVKDLIADETLATAELPIAKVKKAAESLLIKGWVTKEEDCFFIKDHLITLAENIKYPENV